MPCFIIGDHDLFDLDYPIKGSLGLLWKLAQPYIPYCIFNLGYPLNLYPGDRGTVKWRQFDNRAGVRVSLSVFTILWVEGLGYADDVLVAVLKCL